MNFAIPLITNDSKATVYSKFFAITSSLLYLAGLLFSSSGTMQSLDTLYSVESVWMEFVKRYSDEVILRVADFLYQKNKYSNQPATYVREVQESIDKLEDLDTSMISTILLLTTRHTPEGISALCGLTAYKSRNPNAVLCIQ